MYLHRSSWHQMLPSDDLSKVKSSDTRETPLIHKKGRQLILQLKKRLISRGYSESETDHIVLETKSINRHDLLITRALQSGASSREMKIVCGK